VESEIGNPVFTFHFSFSLNAMKRIFLFLSLLFVLLGVKAEPEFLESFKPVERVHNFGKIYEKNGKVSTVFTFKNTGNKAVAISDVNTWCGCMVANYTKKAVRPGETATVKVTLDPDHKSGAFVKQVVLLLNDGKNYVRVWVKADIVAMDHPVTEECPYDYGQGLFMNQTIIPIPNYDAGKDFSMSLKLANNTDKPMTVTFKRNPNNRVLQMPEKVVLRPKEIKTVTVSYHFRRKYTETRYIMLTPFINGKEGKKMKVQWNGPKKFQMHN